MIGKAVGEKMKNEEAASGGDGLLRHRPGDARPGRVGTGPMEAVVRQLDQENYLVDAVTSSRKRRAFWPRP